MISNEEGKVTNINSDITTTKNAIIQINNNTKNKTYNKITDVPNDTNLYSKYNLYNTYITSLNTQINLSNTKNSDLSTTKTQLNTDNNTLRTKTNLLNLKNTELTSKNAELTSKQKLYDAKTAEVKTKNEELKRKNEELKTKNTEFNNLNCSKVKNKANCNEQQKKLNNDIKSLNDTIKTLNDTINTLNNTIKQLYTEIITLKNTTIPGINGYIKTLTTEINMLNSTISRNNGVLNTTNNSISQINTTINTLTNNISSLKTNITTIQNEKTASIAPIQNEINILKNSRFYNRCYIRLNKIIGYINEYNQYDIDALNKKKSDQELILQKKNNELTILITQKNNIITELNNIMKICKTNKDDLNSKLFELRTDVNVCKDVDMCTNKCAKNILCKVNDIFCSNKSWYSIIEKQYMKYFYDVSCSDIDNKNQIIEPFINKMDINKMDMKEGYQQIYINPNIEADISYTNYYSKFINDKLNPEDVSQNMLNLKRNIEIDTYFYLKYNAQIEVLKFIIIVCCISLIGSVFYHNGLITDNLYTIYLSIVFTVGLIYVIYKLFDIYIRDNINFSRFAYEKLFTPYNNVNNTNDFNSSEDCK